MGKMQKQGNQRDKLNVLAEKKTKTLCNKGQTETRRQRHQVHKLKTGATK